VTPVVKHEYSVVIVLQLKIFTYLVCSKRNAGSEMVKDVIICCRVRGIAVRDEYGAMAE
jgi:hypothetical protein